MSSHIDPTLMSTAEIIALLNSGQYISSILKQKLHERLEEDKKSNRFSALDEFFAVIKASNVKSKSSGKKSKTKKNKKNIEDYPILKHLPKKKQFFTNMDYRSLINKQSTTDNVSSSLIVDHQLILPYDSILHIYQFYAAYRIRIHYLSVCRQIDHLNLMEQINPLKGKHFKKIFYFTDLVETEIKLRKCIEICRELDQIHSLMEEMIHICTRYQNMFNTKSPSSYHILMTSLQRFKTSVIDVPTIEKIFVGEYYKYSMNCIEYFRFLTETMEQMEKMDLQHPKQTTDKLNQFMYEISQLSTQIINDNDPHIYCHYHVQIGTPSEPIIPLGLYTWTYVSCEDDITTDNDYETLSEDDLMVMEEDELFDFFHKNINYDLYFIDFYSLKHTRMTFNFHLEINTSKVSVEITDLPSDSHIYYSIIRNPDLEEKLSVPILIPKLLDHERWLTKNVRDELYELSSDEYHHLDPYMQTKYSYYQSKENAFAMDYLFNELLQNDVNGHIHESMYASFKKLALKTSYFK